jgi:hypothetical protein
MVELEISLVKAFGWSLYEIDHTDIESLLPFINRFAGVSDQPVQKTRTYIDQVDWF